MKISIFLIVQLINFSALYSQNSKSIPVWVFNSKYYNNPQYAVGISDPGIDSLMAYEQATIRALINNEILNKSQYGSLTSVAIGNMQENMFDANSIETILYTSIIKGKFDQQDSIQLVKKEFTKYNECCVLFKKLPFKNSNKKTLTYSIVRRTGFEKESNLFSVFIDELEIKVLQDNETVINYLLNRNGNKYSIKSNFVYNNNPAEINLRNIYRNYSLNNNSEKEIDASYYASLSSGLWAAWLFELSDQISFKSILSKNKANQLITLEQGNINKKNKNNSLNKFILSSKKLKTEALKVHIDRIDIQANHLKIKFKQPAGSVSTTTGNSNSAGLKRSDRKRLKKLVKENWIALSYPDISNAFLTLKVYETSNEYLSSSASLETQNQGTGILKALQITRTDIENQLKSKIKTLNKVEIENNTNLSVQSSKTLITEKTKRIEPHFIFFRKINKKYYQLKVILFYKI